MIDNRFNIDCYEFHDEYDEYSISLVDYNTIEKLTYFYECVDNYISERDFDSFLNCVYVKLGYTNLINLFDHVIDVNDHRFRSFLNLIEEQYRKEELKYVIYPTILERVRNFILDKIQFKLGKISLDEYRWDNINTSEL
mgnify:CR=1 FL=1